MAGGSGDDAGRALDALRRIVRALRVSTRALERTLGISAAQLFVLQAIAEEEPRSLGDLVARTLTNQSTVSEVVARLVSASLVTRRPSPEDARRVELTLTARGRALLEKAPRTVQLDLVDGLGRLPAAQRRAIAAGLEAWLAAAGLADVLPGMFFEPAPRRSTARPHR